MNITRKVISLRSRSRRRKKSKQQSSLANRSWNALRWALKGVILTSLGVIVGGSGSGVPRKFGENSFPQCNPLAVLPDNYRMPLPLMDIELPADSRYITYANMDVFHGSVYAHTGCPKYGVYVFQNVGSFYGSFYENTKLKEGTMFFLNGEVFKGTFHESTGDKKEGTVTYADGTSKTGSFEAYTNVFTPYQSYKVKAAIVGLLGGAFAIYKYGRMLNLARVLDPIREWQKRRMQAQQKRTVETEQGKLDRKVERYKEKLNLTLQEGLQDFGIALNNQGVLEWPHPQNGFIILHYQGSPVFVTEKARAYIQERIQTYRRNCIKAIDSVSITPQETRCLGIEAKFKSALEKLLQDKDVLLKKARERVRALNVHDLFKVQGLSMHFVQETARMNLRATKTPINYDGVFVSTLALLKSKLPKGHGMSPIKAAFNGIYGADAIQTLLEAQLTAEETLQTARDNLDHLLHVLNTSVETPLGGDLPALTLQVHEANAVFLTEKNNYDEICNRLNESQRQALKLISTLSLQDLDRLESESTHDAIAFLRENFTFAEHRRIKIGDAASGAGHGTSDSVEDPGTPCSPRFSLSASEPVTLRDLCFSMSDHLNASGFVFVPFVPGARSDINALMSCHFGFFALALRLTPNLMGIIQQRQTAKLQHESSFFLYHAHGDRSTFLQGKKHRELTTAGYPEDLLRTPLDLSISSFIHEGLARINAFAIDKSLEPIDLTPEKLHLMGDYIQRHGREIQARSGGSHSKWVAPFAWPLDVSSERDLKSIYIGLFIFMRCR